VATAVSTAKSLGRLSINAIRQEVIDKRKKAARAQDFPWPNLPIKKAHKESNNSARL